MRLHLDPRVAFVALISYSVAVFFLETWQGMMFFTAALAAALAAARVDLRQVFKSIVPLLFILLFTVVAHIPQGVDVGLFYALRILLLAIATLALAFSYDNMRLVRTFEWFLAPLRRLRVPVDDIATMFSIALRFIPVCMEEFMRVANAQRARAAQLDSGGIVARVRQWSSVLVPMLVGLFRRAGLLAQAMEARCYGGGTCRTSLHGSQRLSAAGWLMMAGSCVACIVLAVAF